MFAIGVHEMWDRRTTWFGRIGLAAMLLSTGVWSWWLLQRRCRMAAGVAVGDSGADGGGGGRDSVALAKSTGRLARAASRRPWSPRSPDPPRTRSRRSDSRTVVAARWSDPPRRAANGHDGGPGGARNGSSARPTTTRSWTRCWRPTHTDWSAAIARSSAAAGLELQTHTAVMAIGGFSGNDPVPTLSEFQQYVADPSGELLHRAHRQSPTRRAGAEPRPLRHHATG